MPSLPSCSGREAVRAFERLGYTFERQKGSHCILSCPGRRPISIPVHKGRDISKTLLKGQITAAGFTVEEFVEEL